MEATLLNAPSTGPGIIPPLDNGHHLSACEFLRRYGEMPKLKKAELIQNIVYIASPVRNDFHGEPDALIQTWLGVHASRHRGVRHATNATVRLGPDDVPQTDAVLFLDSERGGRTSIDGKGYLCGTPELVVEIASSSVSRDAREKLVSYRGAGIQEYLLWEVLDSEIQWFHLEEDEYRPVPSSRNESTGEMASYAPFGCGLARCEGA